MLQCYHRIHQLPDAAWRALAEAQTSPFLGRDWFALFEAQLIPADRAPRYYLLNDAGQRPLALLPCLAEVDGRGRAVRLAALSNYYSGAYGPLLRADADPAAALARLFASLAAAEPACWQLDLRPLRPTAANGALAPALARCGWTVEPYFCHGNWQLQADPGGFEAYWRRRPAALRNTCRRKGRRLARERGWRFELVSAPGPALEAALARFHRLYAASWKRAEPYPEFISAWCRQLAQAGALRLGLLESGGQALAAQIWLVSEDCAYIFKLAHDPEFAGYSPGTLLTRELMAQVLDTDRVARVDFLSGDDPYKRDWMNRRDAFRGLRAYRHGHPRGLAAALASRARQGLKALRGR